MSCPAFKWRWEASLIEGRCCGPGHEDQGLVMKSYRNKSLKEIPVEAYGKPRYKKKDSLLIAGDQVQIALAPGSKALGCGLLGDDDGVKEWFKDSPNITDKEKEFSNLKRGKDTYQKRRSRTKCGRKVVGYHWGTFSMEAWSMVDQVEGVYTNEGERAEWENLEGVREQPALREYPTLLR
ncbi:hypothetical protein BDK51DRAFT_29660 [Blyttiomyces helicus]|uniref:Uncharacterized protein n=1 Tax=Blyttiomyces helicus TaxID=388810 RepID=A0A4P9W5V1_9FUNG|nr:hypothetical protein BDK51DRAFT_29660 [Blyttiomyces helicus]|eukprot:RKO86705.1 hypothetical protein BDK51DRAFT_29660 [Blyttiomyces helicus]